MYTKQKKTDSNSKNENKITIYCQFLDWIAYICLWASRTLTITMYIAMVYVQQKPDNNLNGLVKFFDTIILNSMSYIWILHLMIIYIWLQYDNKTSIFNKTGTPSQIIFQSCCTFLYIFSYFELTLKKIRGNLLFIIILMFVETGTVVSFWCWHSSKFCEDFEFEDWFQECNRYTTDITIIDGVLYFVTVALLLLTKLALDPDRSLKNFYGKVGFILKIF